MVQNIGDAKFQLIEGKNKMVYSGTGAKMDRGFVQLDFIPDNATGYYTLKIDNKVTKPLPIGDEVWLATA